VVWLSCLSEKIAKKRGVQLLDLYWKFVHLFYCEEQCVQSPYLMPLQHGASNLNNVVASKYATQGIRKLTFQYGFIA